jgi:hypothetical protein
MHLSRLLLTAVVGGCLLTSEVNAAPAPPGPILVELFTSQGCSSCPPADAALSDLDGPVIKLAFHVDYWNYIGWTDPYSKKAWSDRQRQYALARKSTRLYTPQAIVHGESDALGSSRSGLASAVKAAAARAQAARLTPLIDPRGGLTVDVHVVGKIPAGSQLLYALVTDGRSTAVKRGENAGVTLNNDHIVRHLATVCDVAATPPNQRCTAKLAAGTVSASDAVVVFVQDPKTMKVYGAAKVATAKP